MSKRHPQKISRDFSAFNTSRLLLGLVLLHAACATNLYATETSTAARPATNGFDRLHDGVTIRIGDFSRWFDGFFDDPDYAAETARARLRVKQSLTLSRHHDAAYQTSFGGALTLPRLSRRWKLLFDSSDDFFEEEDGIQEDLHGSLSETFSSPTFGLQYALAQRGLIQLDLVGGLRLKKIKPYLGPRLRHHHELSGTLSLHTSERLFWYQGDGWRSRTRFDIDQQLHYNLLRQRFTADWSEKRRAQEGVRLTATTFFVQPFDKYRALSYAWDSVYWTRSTAGWQSTTLSVAWRQRLWRRWLIGELKPFLAWEQRIDWKTNPGISLSLSLIFDD